MKRSIATRFLSVLLALVMVLGLLPAMAFAQETEGNGAAAQEASPYSLTIAASTRSKLAPGVTETAVVAYDANGDRVQYFVVNANISTDPTVQVKANYHDNDNTGVWGKATVVEQANAAKEKRGYNVVATTNASYYNVSTGQPTGGFVMEGVNINGNGAGNSYPFFAILKDGTAMIGQKGTFSNYASQIQEAVGGWTMLVWDGKLVAPTSTKYPRSTVGVKANGDVVLMLADGNQKPYSAGLTLQEQGQLMLELGCVAAVELDGGGSATYAAKLEGTDEVVVRNSCCDGTVRSVSNTLMVISTAVADGVFDHANLSTEHAYYTANSNVAIQAVGADRAGGPAELPELTWALTDDSFGTVENGIFRSNGKIGTVTVEALAEGKVVGTVDVTVVHPTEISFSAGEKTVPYGKTSDFTVSAMYNGAVTYVQPDAFDFTVEAGTMDGFIYTAPGEESGIKNATVTAKYKYAELPEIRVLVTYGKGSEILVDFEDGDISEWVEYYGMVDAAQRGDYTNGYTVIYQEAGATSGNLVERGIREEVFLASRENGDPVYSGDYALGYTLDYTQSVSHANWQYAYLYYLGDIMTYRDIEKGINGTRLGMWMYIPEEAVGLCARLAYTYKDAAGKLNTAYLYFTYQYVEKGFSKLTSEKIPEAGWAYVYCDLDAISTSYVTSSYYKTEDGVLTREAAYNYAPAFIQFIVSSSASGAEKCTVYIDDITLDYSDVVDDRDAPLVTNPVALDDQNSYAMGSTLSFNNVTFTADVAEDTSHGTNFTGLDATTAQIYIDGQKVATTFAAGKIASSAAILPDGVHDVTFEIADKQGNYTKVTKQITIAAGAEYPVITVTGAAPAVKADGKLYTGSQYNIMVQTDKVEAIDKITTKIWLNSASKWALEHMTVLSGFEVSYELNELACTAEITISRVEDMDISGQATLVTVPVYAWAWDGSAGWDATYQWNNQGCAPVVTVSYKVKYGHVVYTEDYEVTDSKYIPGFANVRQNVKTELDSLIANLKPTIGIWHSHTEEAVADLRATCTTDGYNGRTACSVCKSVMNWGETLPATGHSFAVSEGYIKCACGEVSKYTGLYTENGKLYYATMGQLQIGWQYVEGNYYFFGRTTYAALNGYHNVDRHYYTFEDYKLVRGELATDEKGVKYYWAGKLATDGWWTVDGNEYYFYHGYAYTGVKPVETSRYSGEFYYYLFGEDGVKLMMLDGFYEGVYYVEGQKIPYLGLVFVDGYYYYISGNAEPIRDRSYAISRTNDLTYPDGTPIAKGTYTFDEEGRMIIRNGLVDGYYYENNLKVPYAGLIEQDGYFYYICDYGKPIVNKTHYILTVNGLCYADGTPIVKGAYDFDEEGRMIIRSGLVDGYYYEQNVKVPYAGLIEQDGYFYYISDHGMPIKNKSYAISRTNDLTYADGTVITKGTYTFDEEGRMVIREGLVDGYYYERNVKVPYAGLIEQDGYYYYISDHGMPIKNKSYAISRTNGLTYPDGTAITKGTYAFDEEGRMIIRNGLVDGYYYENNVRVPYAGLIYHDGYYYYISDHAMPVCGKTYYISRTNDLTFDDGTPIKKGAYEFDELGRMIIK